jgi:U3 small nucleolar RNA-associated protein 3
MYCCHLSFYFILKSERQSVDNHPIVKNILQFRNVIKYDLLNTVDNYFSNIYIKINIPFLLLKLCKQIDTIDEKLEDEVQFIIKALKSGQKLHFLSEAEQSGESKIKKRVKFRESQIAAGKNEQDLMASSDSEMEAEDKNITIERRAAPEQKLLDEENSSDQEEQTIEKRAINYEIEKNKGLTPKRPKEYRNPRVRNRLKSRKALIKRKSIVPKVRPQDKRYTGEATGIRTSVVRAVKIK